MATSILESASHALMSLLVYVVSLGIVLWTVGAIYYDVGRGRWFAWPLVLLWIAAVVAAFSFGETLWQPFIVLIVVFVAFLSWWFSQQPSNERGWQPNFTVLSRFDLDGDTVTVHNVRSTEYLTLDDYAPQHETRVYHLSNLRGVDAAITYWGSPWLCHPMLIFDFGKEGRLCISIEIRYRVGQEYGFLRSLYRQQEIMYVVSDERDAILKRTKYGQNNDLYLYRFRAESEEVTKVFLEYVVSANDLANTPRWYHGLTTNCTTSIYRQRTREIEWDWRWLFNGKLDEMIYDRERLDNSVPFPELKRRSHVNEIANRAPDEGFGDFIRNQLPAYR